MPSSRVTARAKTQIHLAVAYLELEEYERAESVTTEALAVIGTLSSARTVDRVKGLHVRVQSRAKGSELSTLDEKLRTWRRA